MIKVLYVMDHLAGGGAEKLLNDLLPLNDGFITDVLILTEKNGKYIESLRKKGIKIESVPDKIRGRLNQISYIGTYIKNKTYDIIHANLFPVTYYCSIAKKYFVKDFPKLVMTEHSTDNKRRHIRCFKTIERWIYKEYDSIIAISKETKDALVSWLDVETIDSKCIVIENGVELKRYQNANYYSRNEIFTNIKNDDILLCMVGTIKALKNHELMINIMASLPQKYKLLIVGEGPLKEKISEMVRKKKLVSRVKFLGFRADVPEIIKTSDVIVIPSKWEGFGLVAVEAMACGKPVIASDVPGLSDVVDQGGLKATTRQQFVNAILSLEDKNKMERIKRCALIQSRKYDIENTRQSYEKLYKDSLA